MLCFLVGIIVAINNYLVCVCEEFVYYLVTLGAGLLEFDYHRAMEVFHRDEAYEAARARNHCCLPLVFEIVAQFELAIDL